jgi:hypothetical protein
MAPPGGRIEPLESRSLLSAFTVTSTLDNGSPGTLRWAIVQANDRSGSNTIQFDRNVFARPRTIVLGSVLPDLTDSTGTTTINGPAAGVTLTRSQAAGVPGFSIFRIDKFANVALSNLTITGGSAAEGGGGVFNNGTATLTRCTIDGNMAAQYGGGFWNLGTMSCSDCTFSHNTAQYGGAFDNAGTLDLSHCTVTENTATKYAGGVWNLGALTDADTTISQNSAKDAGGIDNAISMVLTHCTIAGNSSPQCS